MPGEEDADGGKNDRCGTLGKEQTDKRQALYGQKECCGGRHEKAEEETRQENNGHAVGHRSGNGERRCAEEVLQGAVFFVGTEDMAGAAENDKKERNGKQEDEAHRARAQEEERRREALHLLHLLSEAEDGAGGKEILPPSFRHHGAEKRTEFPRRTDVDEERVAEGRRVPVGEARIGKHGLQTEELLLTRAVCRAEHRRELPQEHMEFLRGVCRMVRAKLEERRLPGEEHLPGALHAEEHQDEYLESNEERSKRPEDAPFRPRETAKHADSISDDGGTRHLFRASDPSPGTGVARVDGKGAEKERPRFRKTPERDVHFSEVAEREDIPVFQVQGALQGNDALYGFSLMEECPSKRAEDIRSIRLGTIGAAEGRDGLGELFPVDGDEAENKVSHRAFRAQRRRPARGEEGAMHVSHAPFILRDFLENRHASGIFRQ